MNFNFLQPGFAWTKGYVVAHKAISAVALLVLLFAGWWLYGQVTAPSTQTHYVLGTVTKGTVVSSITGSGQVSASNQVDVASKGSGQVVLVNVVAGQTVRAGTLLAETDATDDTFALETAQITYQKLITVDQPTSLRDAQNAVTTAQTNVDDSYTSARASLTKAATDMTDVATGLNNLLDGYLSNVNNSKLSDTDKVYIKNAEDRYYSSKSTLDSLIKNYHSVSAQTDDANIQSMLGQFSPTAEAWAEAAKYAQDAVIYMRDHQDGNQSIADASYSSVTALVSKANTVVSDVAAAKSAIVDGNQTLEKAQASLQDIQGGSSTLDQRAQALLVQQKQEAVNNHFVRAPFDGVVASVAVKKGDTINSGATVATLITTQEVAEISLNEVDAAKVAIGQKATLTFDAIDGLELTGKVDEIDLVGTVTQGVVNYKVKIGFDLADGRIKPGMTVNATIQTAAHQDVLVVPSGAVKAQQGSSYVQVFDPALTVAGGAAGVVASTPPTLVPVEIGISGDTMVEIVSGLSEGQQIVTRTISGTAAKTTAAPAATGRGGLGGGGAIRLGN